MASARRDVPAADHAAAAGNRSDLLDYLERYRASPRRRLSRIERWRRRGWRRRDIAATATSLAGKLAAGGVGAGDRVGIYLKDGPAWAAALFGVLRAGATAVPIDVAHPPELVTRLAGQLDLAAWLADSELPRLDVGCPSIEIDRDVTLSSHEPPPLPPDDPTRVAQVVLTSGTTQLPQSVEVSHANFRAVLDALESEISRYRWLIRLGPRLRLVVALPMSHLYGQFMSVFLPVVLSADVAVVETMPTADLAAAIRRERAWAFAAVPHTLASLLEHVLDEGRRVWGAEELDRRLEVAASLPWLRRWRLFAPLRRHLGRRLVALISGGAALDADVEALWRRLGYVVVQGYGLTEAAPLVTLNHPFHARGGSVGKPLPGVEVRLAADGEILVRGPNVATPGQRGPQVDADGWLHTGDIGDQLEDGSIRFRGRSSDRIVTPAGVNVEATDVAAAFRGSDQVIDATVVERPWGEPGTVCAVLVVYPGTDVADVIRRANASLPDAARIRASFVWPRGDLPRTPTGKVKRREVLDWLRQQGPSDGSGEASRDGADAVAGSEGIDRVLAAIAAPGESLPVDTRIGDVLSSLDRVELAAHLEELYGTRIGDELFAGDQTIEDLVATLRRRAAPEILVGAAVGAGSANRRAETNDSGEPIAETIVPPRIAASPRAASPPPHTGPDPAAWRYSAAARAARFVLREAVMHPLSRFFLRIEVRPSAAAEALDGPFLLAANHMTSVDGVLLFALPPRVRARLAPAARWSWFTDRRRGRWIYFWSVLGLNLFPLVQVGDWRPTLRIAGELADRGYSILIYPEGGISRDGELHPFQRGVAVMSRDLHLPIVPCAMAGLERFLPPGTRRPQRDGLRRKRVAVCVGDPLSAARVGDDLDALVEEIEDRVRDLHEEASAALAR